MADLPDQQQLDELALLGKRIDELNSKIKKANKSERAGLEQELSDARGAVQGLVERICKSVPDGKGITPPLPWHERPGVLKPGVCTSIGRGKTDEVPKTVRTSPVPKNPDIVFLADTTTSMEDAIDDVQARVRSIMLGVQRVEPSAHFAVAQYKDAREHEGLTRKDKHPFIFNLDQPLTDDADAVQQAVGSWTTTGGFTVAEGQLPALHALATAETGWRADSSRILVWFGDAPAHDPLDDVSLAGAIQRLTEADIRVLAISTGLDQLDGALDDTVVGGPVRPGQATQIAETTGGKLYTGVAADELSAMIDNAIKAIPVTVTPQVDCGEGLSVTFSPPSQTVAGGEEASFTEIITVDIDAPEGAVLTCAVHFLIDGKRQGPEFTQTLVINVEPGEDEIDGKQECEERVRQLEEEIARLLARPDEQPTP